MAKRSKPNSRKRHLQRLRASKPLDTWTATRRLVAVTTFGGGGDDLKPGQEHIVVQEAGAWTNYGESGNRLYTSPDALIEAARTGHFERAKIYLNHQSEDEQERQPERDQGKVVGVVTETRWDPSIGTLGALVGVANITSDELRASIANAKELGVLDSYGSFSITAAGETEVQTIGGETYEVVTRFVEGAIPSVDHVTEPAAGGRFLTRLAASVAGREGGPAMKWADLPDAVKAAILKCANADEAKELLAALDLKDTHESLEVDMLAALEAAAPAPEPEPAPAPAPAPEAPPTPAPEANTEVAAALQRIAAVEANQTKLQAALLGDIAEQKLQATGWDEATITYLRPQLKAAGAAEAMDTLIDNHRTFQAAREPAPELPSTMIRGSIEEGSSAMDKFQAALLGMFYRDHGPNRRTPVELNGAKIEPFHSVHEALSYWPGFKDKRSWNSVEVMNACRTNDYMGDERGGQLMRAGRPVMLRAAASRTHFAEIFADTANKVMQSLWSSSDLVDEVTAWASMHDQVDDFNDHRYIKLGEYPNVPDVAEGGTYNTLTTPGDVEEKEGVTKRGFVEAISLEAGYWDRNSQKLSALPKRMMQTMMRTIREGALAEITTGNPTLNSDSVTLYETNAWPTGHANMGTTALSLAGLEAVQVLMSKQVAAGSSKRYGSRIRPWGIIVPVDLESLALRIAAGENRDRFYSVTLADTDAVSFGHDKYKGIRVLVSDQATNTTDWYTQSDPASLDTWVYQTLRGVNSPQFFTQDSETSDSVFDSDQIKWKIRFFTGYEPLDPRSFVFMDV